MDIGKKAKIIPATERFCATNKPRLAKTRNQIITETPVFVLRAEESAPVKNFKAETRNRKAIAATIQ